MNHQLSNSLIERADLHHPARFERLRLAIARDIFCHRLIGVKVTLLLVPRDHPWRITTESAYEDFRQLTHTTLRPRCKDGEMELEVDSGPEEASPWPTVLWTLVLVYVLYAIVSRTSDSIPSLVELLTGREIVGR